ncbi:uncharacterized protein LOC114270470 [Camellia sinensis]|uniref:uncharacterized protein LOC114270470 n=1 Tax=Camellia sinensis TaxID=4442 RepID=UPI001035BC6A|nr:uncharacterized protein LOC114270470 [Camellia sinensis]
MGAAVSMVNYVVDKFSEKGKEIGAETAVYYAIDKSKELPAAVGNIGGNLMGNAADKWKQMSPELGKMGGNLTGKAGEKWKELSPELGKLGGNVVEKSKELSMVVGNMGGDLIQVSKPYIIPATAAIVLLILLYYCGRLFITIMRSLFSYFGCDTVSGGKVIKMMIAPGTRGALVIVRSVFESNPRGYFRGLRGK